MSALKSDWQTVWAALTEGVGAHAQRYTEALYQECFQRLRQKIHAEAGSMSRLGDYDEQLYYHCDKLMSSYRETVILYEQFRSDIVSPGVVEIIDGIITVLASRLREFEESGSSNGENPVTVEKDLIISQSSQELIKACDEAWDGFVREKLPKFCSDWLAGG